MQLAPFVEELRGWTTAIQSGNARAAEKHLEELYRRGASLVASRDLQSLAMELWHHSLDQEMLEHLRLFLSLVQAGTARESRHQPMIARISRAA